MYLPRLAIIGVQPEFPSLTGQERHIYAEIAVLDKSLSRSYPLLYQLHLEALPHDIGVELSLHRYGHLIYGEVRSLDKQKKEIVLSDMSTVHYRHLIVICGESRDSERRDVELAAGLLTLRGSLKMQHCLAQVLSQFSVDNSLRRSATSIPTSTGSLSSFLVPFSPSLLTTSRLQPRCLYEVQT